MSTWSMVRMLHALLRMIEIAYGPIPRRRARRLGIVDSERSPALVYRVYDTPNGRSNRKFPRPAFLLPDAPFVSSVSPPLSPPPPSTCRVCSRSELLPFNSTYASTRWRVQ